MAKQTKRVAAKVAQKQLELRERLWPDVGEDQLWHRLKDTGFATIPRTMPLILKIMNEVSKNKPLDRTYLDLWCRAWDESIVVIPNQEERAFYAGFSAQRAVATWKDRMRKLVDLGFISAREGSSGPFNYVLIKNPHLVIKRLVAEKVSGLQPATVATLQARLIEIGGEPI